jgi:TonB family protein
MTSSASKCLLAAAALAGAALSFTASAECLKPQYPKQSLRREEEGVTRLAFLIRTDGTVGRTVVLESSVSADLDHAAQAALEKCVFKPATDHGEPVETWQPVMYNWSLNGDAGMTRAKQALATAANNGDLNALYRLSALMSMTARSDADRQSAFVLLQSAADKGVAPAQFRLGRAYEKGYRVKANLEEAMRWYERAAAQGDELAIERVRSGPLPF